MPLLDIGPASTPQKGLDRRTILEQELARMSIVK